MVILDTKMILITLFLTLFVFPFAFGIIYGSTQPSTDVEEEETDLVNMKMPSYLGISLGMGRSKILNNGHFISDYANHLEIISSDKDIDKSIIKAKAVPFIDRIYFQFVKKADMFITPPVTDDEDEEEITTTDDEDEELEEEDEFKLYEISIQFNEEYVGYYELLELLTDGLNLPKFSIKLEGYGTPESVEAEKAVWLTDKDSEGNQVKIILTRSNKINQFGNVVRFIHTKGFDYIVDLNNPMTNPSELQDSFKDIEALSQSPDIQPVIENQYISKIGRKTYFLSALLPQINMLEEDTDEDDEEE